MTRFLHVSDIHLADRSPGFRKNYPAAIKDKLVAVRQILETGRYDAVTFAGDYFHHKDGFRTSHALVRWFIEWLNSLPVPRYGILGNHDLRGGQIETLSRQPIGVVLAAGALALLDAPIPLGEVWLAGSGFSYANAESFDWWRRPDLAARPGVKVLLTHAEMTAAPERWAEHIGWRRWQDAQAETSADIVLNGHYHASEGVWAGCVMCTAGAQAKATAVDLAHMKVYANLGAVCRLDVRDLESGRIPAVADINVVDGGVVIRRIPLPAIPAVDAYDVDRLHVRRALDRRVEGWIGKLARVRSLPSLSGDPADVVRRRGHELGVPDAVIERSLHYIAEG